MMHGVWCRGCRVAWMADVAAQTGAAVNQRAVPVRCPRCSCHRRVTLTGDEETFRRSQPHVEWLQAVR